MFPVPAQTASTAHAAKPVNKQQAKEEKWGGYRDAHVQEIARMELQGWVVAYADGSAKTVQGWAPAGYGVYYAASSTRNFAASVPESERQSVSRGEPRGVLHALLHRRSGERLLVVLDSEYVFRGITKWSVKWRRHDWRTASGEVGHRDPWEQILWERERAGDQVQVRWIPSHPGVPGNHGADALAAEGRRQHPNNSRALPKRRHQHPWDDRGRVVFVASFSSHSHLY